MKTYGHSFQVHLLGPGFPVAMGWLAYRSSVDKFVNGGEAERYAFVTACVLLGLFAAWLYWKSSVNRYQISDAGLVVLRWRSRRVIPWEEIDEIVWKRLPIVFSSRGKAGRWCLHRLIFSTTCRLC